MGIKPSVSLKGLLFHSERAFGSLACPNFSIRHAAVAFRKMALKRKIILMSQSDINIVPDCWYFYSFIFTVYSAVILHSFFQNAACFIPYLYPQNFPYWNANNLKCHPHCSSPPPFPPQSKKTSSKADASNAFVSIDLNLWKKLLEHA